MRTNKLIVVVHVTNDLQDLRNAKIAYENGADGVFLINHDVWPGVLLEVHRVLRRELPRLWVGFNFLGVSAIQAVRILPEDADGFWIDDAGIEPQPRSGGFKLDWAKAICNEREAGRKKHIQYFGGVAFKYRAFVRNFEKAAALASPFVDVITTSGPATGSPPTLEKIVAMRKGAGDKPLAIASGMTPENVTPYLDYADYFLVATGISKSHTELDPSRVRMMAERMRR